MAMPRIGDVDLEVLELVEFFNRLLKKVLRVEWIRNR